MKLNRYDWLIPAIAVLSFAIAGIFYPQMPEVMASHWNARGEVDGYISRFWGLFLMPIISLALAALFVVIPRIDPMKANIEKFKGYYYGFVMLVMLFFTYLYVLTLVWNTGTQFNLMQLLAPAFGVLLFGVGVMVGRAKRNYFIGIRTPWTLNNEEVWDRTHRLGGLLFKITGIIAIIGVFFPDYMIYLILVPVLVVSLVTIVYSYIIYRRLVQG